MPDTLRVRVPFVDLGRQHCSIQADLEDAVHRVVSDGQFSLGPCVERFEAAFARYLGVAHCVGLNSGTSALHLALRACELGPGDEVITTPHTWISTSWAISYVGAKPVFVDIDPVSFNLDPARVEKAITPRTRAILPVHLYGQACDLDALGEIAARHHLVLIEDASQAHGARYKGRAVGTFGKVGCFSFYPSKNLGAFGEAGAVVTDHPGIAQRIRQLRDHAQTHRHVHAELGFNARMEAIQGAVLEVKLHRLDGWNAERRRRAHRYHELLSDLPALQLPGELVPGQHAWHLFVLLLRGIDREEIRKGLAQRGIATGVHYPTPVPLQPAYAQLGYRPGDLPVAEDVMHRCITLPLFPGMTDEELEWVAAALRDCVG